MKYTIDAIDGIKTDDKVLAALSKLNKYGSDEDEVTVEIKHDKAKKTSTCKILGFGKRPTVGKGEHPGVAVRDAVKQFTSDLSNDTKKTISKKKQVRRTCAKRKVATEIREEENFGR